MNNWFARLFAHKAPPRRVHAWHWSQWGRAYVVGEVVGETERSFFLDPSAPERQEFRATVHVWKRDARPVGEPLPVDLTPNDP